MSRTCLVSASRASSIYKQLSYFSLTATEKVDEAIFYNVGFETTFEILARKIEKPFKATLNKIRRAFTDKSDQKLEKKAQIYKISLH